MKCKHCGSSEVGRKATYILKLEWMFLGDLTKEDFIKGIENIDKRVSEFDEKNIIDVFVDRLYCFDCDKYQE